MIEEQDKVSMEKDVRLFFTAFKIILILALIMFIWIILKSVRI